MRLNWKTQAITKISQMRLNAAKTATTATKTATKTGDNTHARNRKRNLLTTD